MPALQIVRDPQRKSVGHFPGDSRQWGDVVCALADRVPQDDYTSPRVLARLIDLAQMNRGGVINEKLSKLLTT